MAHDAARPRLDRGSIVAAAVRFIDERGLGELTMRRLGAYLGVEGMALYRYVAGREALLDAVVEAVADEVRDLPEAWAEHLRRLAHGMRRIALAHPEVFPLVATRPAAAPWLRPPLRSPRAVESLLRALTSAGFADATAASVYRSFSGFLLGHLLLEVSAAGAETAAEKNSDIPPIVRRMRRQLSADRAGADFEAALEALLGRVELQLPGRTRPGRGIPRNRRE